LALVTRSIAVLTLMCLSTLVAQPARADRVIGPGQEEHVLSLFAPAALGDEVVTGYRLMDVSIHAREIGVRLEPTHAAGGVPGVLSVRLVALDEPLDGGVAFATSESFALVTNAEPGEAQRAPLDQLATRVRGNDDGSFWVEIASEASAPGTPGGGGFGPLARIVTLAAIIAVLTVAVFLRRRRKRSKNVE